MSTLKVQEIQHTGGTTGLTIDSSGRVLTPTRPMFFARMETNTDADSVVKFDDIQINVGSCYSSSTGRFTAIPVLVLVVALVETGVLLVKFTDCTTLPT